MKIVKVPSDLGSLGRNKTKKAADAIIKKLKEYIKDFEIGSVEINEDNIDETDRKISEKEGDIFIGGDHSITYSCFKNFSRKYKTPGLLVFDAHADCMDNFKITHEDWLRVLIEEKFVKPENVVLVGLRNVEKNEMDYLKNKGITYFFMENIVSMGDVCDVIMERMRACDGFYISIDIDSVDPAFAPGTGVIEPAGFTSRELLYFVKRLRLLKNLRRIDLVEVNSERDVNEMTVKLGARIIYEFMR